MTLGDLHTADEAGRWWLVGAAWHGSDGTAPGVTAQPQPLHAPLDELAAPTADAVRRAALQQRMNTDVRRAIFAAIMSADDYMDAFERLMRYRVLRAARHRSRRTPPLAQLPPPRRHRRNTHPTVCGVPDWA